MKQLKIIGIGLITVAALAAIVPGSALAAKGHHAKKVKAEVGQISAYTAGSSVTINGVSIRLTKNTKLVAEDAASAATGPIMADEAVALVSWHKGTATARKLEYGATNFAYLRKAFSGRYQSNGLTTLTISLRGRKPVTQTFNTDTNTKYYDNHHAVSSPAYLTNEQIKVRGEEFTDGSWYAAAVSLHHKTKGKGH